MKWLAVPFFLVLGVAWAQDRDFLTPNEIDQVRQTQEPNQRLTLYAHFASERIDLIKQYLSKDKPGRSLFIHNTIEDYNNIIEAIDTVSDDALKRHVDIERGTIAVLDAEKDFLQTLQKIKDGPPPRDFERYRFVLDQAIATTSDSRDLAMEDSKKRTGELAAEDEKERKDREAAMPTAEAKQRRQEQQDQTDKQKKIPSLLRPGEKPPDQSQ
jgi:hypothetical protein